MTDLALHFVGGAALGALIVFWPTGLTALIVPLIVGYVREAEQRPHKRWKPWRWSPHAWAEWWVWPLGALVALVCF
jgi:hypothetical protein